MWFFPQKQVQSQFLTKGGILNLVSIVVLILVVVDGFPNMSLASPIHDTVISLPSIFLIIIVRILMVPFISLIHFIVLILLIPLLPMILLILPDSPRYFLIPLDTHYAPWYIIIPFVTSESSLWTKQQTSDWSNI